jgi:hypothetical protein
MTRDPLLRGCVGFTLQRLKTSFTKHHNSQSPTTAATTDRLTHQPPCPSSASPTRSLVDPLKQHHQEVTDLHHDARDRPETDRPPPCDRVPEDRARSSRPWC